MEALPFSQKVTFPLLECRTKHTAPEFQCPDFSALLCLNDRWHLEGEQAAKAEFQCCFEFVTLCRKLLSAGLHQGWQKATAV